MGLIDTVRDAAELVQKADNIDLLRQLLKVQQEAMALLEENRALKEQLRERDERERLTAQLVYRDNAYWLRDGEKERAYCLRCWDADRKLVTLLVGDGTYSCLNCGKRWARSSDALPRQRVVRRDFV
jgi:hypothetical protein